MCGLLPVNLYLLTKEDVHFLLLSVRKDSTSEEVISSQENQELEYGQHRVTDYDPL